MDMDTAKNWMEAGAWVGRQQAFAVIASKCSAAQAAALKEIKESRSYEQLGLSWEEFALQYVGVGRERADALIRQYAEFGEAYFRLSRIARISPATYRQVAPTVENDTVEIDGEKLDLTLPNAVKIRAAIRKMRDQLNQAREAAGLRQPLALTDLRNRLDALVEEARRLSYYYPPNSSRNDLVGLTVYAINKWKELARELQQS
jgi:uncharacterized protein YPO0396